MAKQYIKPVFILIISTLLFSCAAYQLQTTESLFNPYEFKADKYEPKVENFIIILDASSSMSEKYKGQSKFKIAKDFLSALNQTIPNLKINGALRTFGHDSDVSNNLTTLFYGLAEYSSTGLEAGLKAVKKAGGTSPLPAALKAASNDLESTHGKIAIIIISDGKDMGDAPLVEAENMKSQFGERICIYTVLVGNNPEGKKLMERIAGTNSCGFSLLADELKTSRKMAQFVKEVFITESFDSDGDGVNDNLDHCPDTPKGVKVDARGCPIDTDGDGVYDYLDKCPNTPSGVKVDDKGCPIDTDGDGVYDYLDKCPNTPSGVKVDDKGCPIDTDGDGVYDYLDKCPNTPSGVRVDDKGCPIDTDGDGVYDYLDKCPRTPKGAKVNIQGCWILGGVAFDTGKSNIRSDFHSNLDDIVAILNKNPDLKIEIQGHTDNVGSALYNMNLSENRANAVMEYFLKKGIGQERLSAKGFGLTMPIASNDTPEGRAQNRRVELKLVP